MFGNVIQDYDRASSDDMMTVMETCRVNSADLSNLPLRYESTQQFNIDWCKMNVSNLASCMHACLYGIGRNCTLLYDCPNREYFK